MSQVDIAGSIPTMLRVKGRVVIVAFSGMTFLRPSLSAIY
jgi:acyl-CoA hydrolase